MPFKTKDAQHHTKKANTKAKRRLWTKIANKERKRIGDRRAIMAADSVIAKQTKRKRRII